jgi:hypothetical protein
MTELAELLRGVRNYNVAVKEIPRSQRAADFSPRGRPNSERAADFSPRGRADVQNPPPSDPPTEGIVFLHKIIEGGASKSYGIHVARLAGLPPQVVARSREVLDELQRGFERETKTPQLSRKKTKNTDQLPLFRDPAEDLLAELRSLNLDETAPIDALKKLAHWKSKFG